MFFVLDENFPVYHDEPPPPIMATRKKSLFGSMKSRSGFVNLAHPMPLGPSANDKSKRPMEAMFVPQEGPPRK